MNNRTPCYHPPGEAHTFLIDILDLLEQQAETGADYRSLEESLGGPDNQTVILEWLEAIKDQGRFPILIDELLFQVRDLLKKNGAGLRRRFRIAGFKKRVHMLKLS